MRWIYLSPHFDDAALSAGGLIREQADAGIPVEIWTLMGGVPQGNELSMFAQVNHFTWGVSSAEEAVRVRRAEDENAARIVGAKTVHFDFMDCIYRRGKNGDWLYDDIFRQPHEDDAELPRQIAASLPLAPDDVLVCPLALGSHVDHVLARRAAESLNRPLLYYADVPYLFKYPESLSPSIVGMKANVRRIAESSLRSWIEGTREYSSQLSGLFESPDQMEASIRQYWLEQGEGIRLWETAARP